MMNNMPVFPLPTFLLPQGITRLKIFEPRYLTLIKIATKHNGFAIVLNELLGQQTMTASWVEIINFDASEHGILIVDVKCKGLISLTSSYQSDDQLLWANYTPLSHWHALVDNPATKFLSQLLQKLFAQNNELFKLYDNQFIDTPNWVMSRWLELLPIDAQHKRCFFEPESDQQAQLFLADLLAEKNNHE